MSNERRRPITPRDARRKSHVLIPVRLGYLDGIHGRPYAQDHERAEPWWQHNYAAGRLIAAECRALGTPVAWPASTALPRRIEEISRLVAYSLLRRQDHA
jgi:hypothetical protein